MTDPAGLSSRQAPKRPPARIGDLSLLVRVPGRPDAVRAFTAAEQGDAETYAAVAGGIVEPLPLAAVSGHWLHGVSATTN